MIFLIIQSLCLLIFQFSLVQIFYPDMGNIFKFYSNTNQGYLNQLPQQSGNKQQKNAIQITNKYSPKNVNQIICTNNMHKNKLQIVEQFIYAGMKQQISNIQELNLQYYTNLKQIILPFNRIQSLPNLQFIKKLSNLNIGCNIISNIDEFCHGSYPNLKWLGLFSNKIKKIPTRINTIRLEYLNISDNQMQTIYEFLYESEYPNLRELVVNHNKIETIPILKFKQLQIFSASQNKLSKLDQYVFEYCQKIRQIDLSFNRLNKVPKLNLPKLQKICLDYNQIQEMGVFSQMQYNYLINVEIKHNKVRRLERINMPILQELIFFGNQTHNIDKYIKKKENHMKLSINRDQMMNEFLIKLKKIMY